MAEDGYKVTLNVYDLSQGLARQLSPTFLGKTIDGIWHTGVVVYGTEYFFGGGIQRCPAGSTPYGRPVKVVDLGVTHLPREVFEDYLQEISPRYTMEKYNLFKHNCNNFSNEVAQFLVGSTIPEYILNLPDEVLNSPMSPLIMPMIQQLEATLRANAAPQAPQFSPPSYPAQSSQVKQAASNSRPSPDATNEGKGKVESSASGKNGKASNGVEDPLGTARNRLQEEITKEFSMIMASGALRASEAAALATRRVMERYGRVNVGVKQG